MRPRPDLIDARSPAGLEVYQLTDEPEVPASHVYMEAQIFTPDSRRLVLHRSATPHRSDRDDPKHRYLLCDLENAGELSPLTDELAATGPCVSPDGAWLYYFVDQTQLNAGRLILKRVKLDGTQRETVITLDQPAENCLTRISKINPNTTISSDGRRIAVGGFLGDGRREPAIWGVLVFDLDRAAVHCVVQGQTWCNAHPQYSRNPGRPHDLMLQQNHGNVTDAAGNISILGGWPGCDIHVIRDDATDLRDLPFGRDGVERCQGHQCWRGRSDVVLSTVLRGGECPVIEGLAQPHGGHQGRLTPNPKRNELAAAFNTPHFYHFATDIQGETFVTDHVPDWNQSSKLHVARFGEPLKEPLRDWQYLLDTRTVFEKDKHTHPFLSPDGTMVFFNAEVDGVMQPHMARGF